MISTRSTPPTERRHVHPRTWAFIGWLLAALACFCVPLQRAAGQTGEVDPPSRVARLSDLSGNVWLYRPDAGDWVPATRNLPLTSGDTLSTEPGARAELQVGSATFRLDGGSELQVSVLDDSRISLQLHAGALAVQVRSTADTGALEVGTDEGRFLVLAAGRYRFDRGTGSSFVGVDSGQVRYEYTGSALTVNPGQRAEFWIDANGAAQYGLGGPVYDAFTAWNNDRDRAAERSSAVAARYVSPEMTGVADLDRYGSWEQNPDYGAVWVPAAVAADWAPYSAGRWAWVSPWGWTWVDDAPWGFAPFHYGRWVNLRNRWCWTPGAREPRPVYAPALVGWVGPPRGAASVGIGVGVGPAVGWFPLAPREVFVPSYRGSARYVRNLNTPNVRRGDNIDVVIRNPLAPREFENRRFPRAVTVVPAAVFGERRSLAPAAAQYREAPWARDFARSTGSAPVLNAAPVAPPPSYANRPGDMRPTRPAPGLVEQRAAGPGRAEREREREREGGSHPEPFRPNAGGAAFDPPRREGGGDPRDRRGAFDRNGSAPPDRNPTADAPVRAATPGVAAPAAPTDAGNPTPPRMRPFPVRPSADPGERNGQQGTQQDFRRPSGAPPAAQSQRPGTQPASETPFEAPRVRPLPMTRPSERPQEQPVRSDAAPTRAEQAPMRRPEAQPLAPTPSPMPSPAPQPMPPQSQMPSPAAMPPPTPAAAIQPVRPAPAAPPAAQRPVETAAPSRPVEAQPRRMEGPRPAPSPAAETQRAAPVERRNEPNSTR